MTENIPKPSTNDFAGLQPRLLAFLLDYLLIVLYIGLLVAVAFLVPSLQSLFQTPVQSDIVAFLILVLPVVLYFGLQEGTKQQATWGKRRMKLKVIQVDGTYLGMGRALVRAATKFLPWQIAHTAIFHMVQDGQLPLPLLWTLVVLAYLLPIAYIVLIWKHPAHRTIYDWLAGSVVAHNEHGR